MAKSASKAATLRPDGFQEGGGLLDDIDVTFAENRFAMFDYGGTQPTPVPALKSVLVDADGGETEQHWSAGSPDSWVASEDGKNLLRVGTAEGIVTTCNLAIFLTHLCNAGFPEDGLDEDISALDGLQAHVVQIPAPKRPGLPQRERADGRDYPKTILVVDKILALPGEKPKRGAKGKATGASAAVDEELDTTVTEIVLGVLEENPDGLTRTDLAKFVLRKAKASKDRSAIVKRAGNEEFLATGPWDYENGLVTPVG